MDPQSSADVVGSASDRLGSSTGPIDPPGAADHARTCLAHNLRRSDPSGTISLVLEATTVAERKVPRMEKANLG